MTAETLTAPSESDEASAIRNPTPEQQAHLDRMPKSFWTVKEAAERNGWKPTARARVTEYGTEVVNMKVIRLGTLISLTFVAPNPGDTYRLRHTYITLAGLELRSNLAEVLTRIGRPVPA